MRRGRKDRERKGYEERGIEQKGYGKLAAEGSSGTIKGKANDERAGEGSKARGQIELWSPAEAMNRLFEGGKEPY